MIVNIGLCTYVISTDINWKALKTQAQRERSRFTVHRTDSDSGAAIAETPDGFRIHVTRTYEVPASWRTSDTLASLYINTRDSYHVTVLDVVRRCKDAIAAQQYAASWAVAHYWDHPDDTANVEAEAAARP